MMVCTNTHHIQISSVSMFIHDDISLYTYCYLSLYIDIQKTLIDRQYIVDTIAFFSKMCVWYHIQCQELSTREYIDMRWKGHDYLNISSSVLFNVLTSREILLFQHSPCCLKVIDQYLIVYTFLWSGFFDCIVLSSVRYIIENEKNHLTLNFGLLFDSHFFLSTCQNVLGYDIDSRPTTCMVTCCHWCVTCAYIGK